MTDQQWARWQEEQKTTKLYSGLVGTSNSLTVGVWNNTAPQLTRPEIRPINYDFAVQSLSENNNIYKGENMSSKFYKVIKDNFLWEVGAIITSNGLYYRPIDGKDFWDLNEFVSSCGIPEKVVENSPDYFQRVYPVNLVSKTVYKVKEEAKEFFNKEHSE